MTEGPFLRVFAFTPSRSGVIDSVLRDELLPDLTRQRDVLDAYAGRHGTGDTGERLVVSIWSSQEAMDAWPGEGQLIAEHSQIADGTETVRHAAGAIAVALMFERDEEARVLRVFEGEVHDGTLADYVEGVRRGARADGAENSSLIALYLVERPDAGFLTVSAWTDWEGIEAATGGDLGHPIRTRYSDRVTILNVTHYEILPGVARPATTHLGSEAAVV